MVIKQFALFAFLVLAGLSNGQDMFGDDKHSYVLLPAEVVSSGIVSQVDFSPSRRYVIYRRADIATYEASLVNKDVPQKFQWFRYDTVSKVNQKIQVPESTQELMVLGDDQSVYYIGGELGKEQGFLDLRNGAITKTSFDLMTLVYTGDETFAPFFIFKTGDFNVQLLKPSGQTISFVLPVKLRYFRPIGSNAKTITFTAMGEGKRGNLTYHYGDAKAVFKELSSDELDKQRREAEPRNLFWFENIGDLAYVKLMDLPKNLVTDLPKMAKLGRADCLPRFGTNSVVYEDAGALLIREIKPLDTALARKLQMEAAKANRLLPPRLYRRTKGRVAGRTANVTAASGVSNFGQLWGISER